MEPIKKLNIIMFLVLSIPLIIGLYLLNLEGTIIRAEPFHFYFVLVSALASLVLSIIAFIENKRTNVTSVLMIAVAFLGVSIFYAFHGFITPNYSLFSFESPRDQLNLFVLYGDLSRFWLAIFLFFSGVHLQKLISKVGFTKFILISSTILVTISIAMVYIPSLIPNVKNLDGTDSQFSILIKVVTLTLFGTTITRYHSSYKIKPNLSVLFLIIGLSLVFGSVIIFMISTPWGPLWWMAHVLYLLTYLIIGFGVLYNYKKRKKFEYFDVLDEVKNYVQQLDESNKQLEVLVSKDILTNLPNRNCFISELDLLIKEDDNKKRDFGLLFIDIDDFKAINDTYGHQVGDAVLKVTSSRIKNLIKTKDLPARLGGDEFVVLLKDIKEEDLSNVASRLINTISEPITIEGESINIHVSIGIALYPSDALTSDELINKSDKAMYKAKKDGKNTFAFFENTLL